MRCIFLGFMMMVLHVCDASNNPFEMHSKKLKQQSQSMQTILLPIYYAKAYDVALLLNQHAGVFLSTKGVVGSDARTNSIWVKDTVHNINEVKKMLAALDVPLKQVMIEARIVNMTQSSAEDLGIRLGPSASTVDKAASAAPSLNGLSLDLAAMPLDANPLVFGVALAKLADHVLLDLELSALESAGEAEIIARPRLLTLNQQSALIKSGEDIPYQEATPTGATSVSFKQAVMSLKVTPQITPKNQLMMTLVIHQDSDSGQRVQGVPIILTKSIETNVLVRNGQTIVLGGIYKQDKNKHHVRVPFLSHLPLIGSILQRKEHRIKNEELLIFITPRIISPI